MPDSVERADDRTPTLEGWKSIAAYLSRDVRTAKRWEAGEALPVHRHHHSERSSVYAFPDELDAWRAGRGSQRTISSSFIVRQRRALMIAPVMLMALLTAGGGHPGGAVAARQTSADDDEGFRKVWAGFGSISRDGRRAVYIDPRGNPVLHDVATGVDRALTTTGSYAAEWAADQTAISRDARHVAYTWWPKEGPNEIRIANLDAAASPRILLVVNEDTFAYDWSPDGRHIALGGQFGVSVVSVENGLRRPLHTLNGRAPTGVFFSPDGRYVAFDAYADKETDPFDVFVLALDGSGVSRVVASPAHDRLMDWSPDGRHLLFLSDRSGSVDLWAQPVAASTPDGNARMIRRGLDVRRSFGMGHSDRLFVSLHLPDRDVEVVPIDLESGRLASPPARPIQQFVGMNEQPAWSRDGKYLAYVSRRDREPFPVIAIRAEDTGEVKELRPNMPNLRGISWSPNGQELLVGGHDLRDDGVMFRIDVPSGVVTRLPVSPPQRGYASFFGQWSPDGRRVYYLKSGGSLVERDLASDEERELMRGDLGGHRLSPDGQWIAVVHSRQAIALVPVGTGTPRQLFPVVPPDGFRVNRLAWTPDSRGVIVNKTTRNETGTLSSNELWLVPIDGTTMRKLDVDVTRIAPPAFSGIELHPDGKRLAFASDGESRNEVWVLENVVSSLTRR